MQKFLVMPGKLLLPLQMLLLSYKFSATWNDLVPSKKISWNVYFAGIHVLLKYIFYIFVYCHFRLLFIVNLLSQIVVPSLYPFFCNWLRHEDVILIGSSAVSPGRQLRTFRRNCRPSKCVRSLTNEQRCYIWGTWIFISNTFWEILK